MLYYQLPPRGFWFWWCDGLHFYDALVVALWVGINVLYVEQRTSLVVSLYKGEQPTHLQTDTRAHSRSGCFGHICPGDMSRGNTWWVVRGRRLPWTPSWQDAKQLPALLGKVCMYIDTLCQEVSLCLSGLHGALQL